MNQYRVFRARRGMTLVELLVVIAIIGLLAAAVLPMLASTAERRGREAASTLASMAVRSNGWARQLKEPDTTAGLTLTPVFNRDPTAAIQPEDMAAGIAPPLASADMSVSQTQPAYSGDSTDSRAYCVYQYPALSGGTRRAVFAIRKDTAQTLQARLARTNSAKITVEGINCAFSLIPSPPVDLSTADPAIPPADLGAWWFADATALNAGDTFDTITGAKQYTISLTPIPSLPSPLKMPGEYVVDVSWCSVGSSLLRPISNPMALGCGQLSGIAYFDGYMPVHFLFDSLGDLRGVFCQQWIAASRTSRIYQFSTMDSIYLLVGRVDRAGYSYNPTPSDDNPGANWQYPDSRWVRIYGRDGLVLIADPVPNATTVFASQGYARRGISSGRL